VNAAEWANRVKQSVCQVVYGKEKVIEKLIVSFLCGGHVLLEDVPGVGKTILARAFSTSIGGGMQRIQCTPDLMPADVLGVSVFNRNTGQFDFRPGPVVTNVLLVDEINRATPRTQSALLQAMEECRITVDGRTVDLPLPFILLATENPVEFEGTFPLPEAQKDRFFLSLTIGYPPEVSEKQIMESHRRVTHPVSDLVPVTDTGEVAALKEKIREVSVDGSLVEYILDLIENTRKDSRLKLGASPRASMALYRGAQALAAIRGRDEVTPEDLGELAGPILLKRIAVTAENLLKGITEEDVIADILESTSIGSRSK
jgi:MoxR-like ATPase